MLDNLGRNDDWSCYMTLKLFNNNEFGDINNGCKTGSHFSSWPQKMICKGFISPNYYHNFRQAVIGR